MNKDLSVSILIPAYNEEKSIKKCVESCLMQSEKADEIIIVNDGSTDRTIEFIISLKDSKIFNSFKSKVKIIDLKKNTGNKSKAQEIGLRYVTGDIFITTDADTMLDYNFIKQIKDSFKEEPDSSAVCGFVESKKNNWITNVREINYIVGQTLYKKAQSYLNSLFVVVGCGSAFKTEDFRKIIKFEHDNVTEDLDFTYKIKMAGKKIVYNEDALVYTQDPNNLKSYFRQLYRWYSGGWYCLKKNINILKKPNNALILSLIYIEGLIMGMAMLIFPFLLFWNPKYFGIFLLLTLGVVCVSSSYGIFKSKRYELFLYVPHQYAMGFFEQILFLYTFLKEIIFNKKNLIWYRPDRY